MGLLLDNHLVGLEVVLMVSLCLIGIQILTVQYRKFFSSHCGTSEKSLVSYLFYRSSSSVIDGNLSEPTLKCMGSLVNFSSILSQAFRASTVFVGIAVLFSILCVACQEVDLECLMVCFILHCFFCFFYSD